MKKGFKFPTKSGFSGSSGQKQHVRGYVRSTPVRKARGGVVQGLVGRSGPKPLPSVAPKPMPIQGSSPKPVPMRAPLATGVASRVISGMRGLPRRPVGPPTYSNGGRLKK